MIAVAFSGGVVTANLFHKAGERKALKAQIEQIKKLQEERDLAQQRVNGLTDRILKDTAEIVTVRDTVHTKQVIEVAKPVYTDCVLPASGVALQNESRAKLNTIIQRGPQ